MAEVYVIYGHEAHDHPNHPENARRVEWILEEIEEHRTWKRTDPELPYFLHEREYVDLVKNHVGWLDPDTYVTSRTFEVAARSLTAARDAPESSFILTRPPGHHATRKRGMGFCIFNNAVAASLRDETVGILDVDAHHGNGTEDLLPGNAVYASVHMGAGYPGTGHESDERRMNVPVYHPLTDSEFVRFLEKAFRFFEERGVEFVVVSLGFDGLYSDPLTYFSLTSRAYLELGKRLKEWSWKAVLEGGYSKKIGEAARAFLDGV